MKTRTVLTVLIAAAVFGAIFGYKFLTIRRALAARAAQVRPPATVSATSAREETWPNSLHATGSCASFRGITIKTELEGAVRRIAFESGASVAAGTPLVDLDDSIESASLPGLEAQARLASANLGRARELRAAGTNTVADLDAAEAAAAQTQAAVAQLHATLAKKHIVAPFAGRLGIALIHPGQFLGKAESIVQLETLDSVYVDFTLPQQTIGRVAAGQTVRVQVDAFPDRVFEGTIAAIAPRVSDATRSLSLRATVPNRDEALRPGMFGRVEVLLPGNERTIVLPGAAVVYNPYGNFVYVVENGVARQRFIQTGPQRGNLIAVVSGLNAGETVVTSGQIKLRNGSPVRVDNSAAPSANPAPKPVEG
ncbi:MAG: efflux RND transporter periplasmic adaptor subunit [Verrucomicrobia bacterium]|nr:efflux RND transporter periplasmic adaptor subunit [Verrucomicrobiota bacterium]